MYKVNEVIKVNVELDIPALEDVKMAFYDAAGLPQGEADLFWKASGQYYQGEFTPNTVGTWVVMVYSATAKAKMHKEYRVVAVTLEDVNAKLDEVLDKIKNGKIL